MAKINDTTVYPNTTPALTDHFPITDVSNTTNDANGETVTCTFQATLDLIHSNLDISNDTTPQLGGDLDVNSNSLVSTSNGDIDIAPNGTGRSTIDRVQNTHVYNAQTGTTYTLVAADQDSVVTMNNASANTLTIPTNASVAFPTGTKIEIWAIGAGTTTIAGDTGVTLQGNGGSASAGSCDIQTQYGGATLTKIASDTWMVGGDIDAVA